MKIVFGIGGVIGLGLGAAAFVTNPGPEAYGAIASQRVSVYLEKEVCPELPTEIGQALMEMVTGGAPKGLGGFLLNQVSLDQQCTRLVQSDWAKDRLQETITAQTTRQNFGLFSLYATQVPAREFITQLATEEKKVPKVIHSIGAFNLILPYRMEH